MLPRRLALTCAFILGVFAFTIAAPEDFYRARFGQGVNMGMSPEELAKARPTARILDRGAMDRRPGEVAGPPVEMFEMRRERDRASVISYRFKTGKLGAVLEGTKLATKTTIVPIEQTQAAVDKLAEELKANFVLKGQEQIVRSGGIDGAALVTAQLWEDKAKGLHLYFVATNQEIDIVIFDPKAFAKADFFAGPETLEKSKASMASIRRQLGDRADPPMPLIDLLAKPATEKK